jgi:FKBP-type peptidyl-prolyl cis-trans isomerase FkpA
MKFSILVIFSFVIFFTACRKEDACNYNECSVVVSDAESQMVKDYLDANSITATKHCSGMYYIVENAGTGATPNICNYISIHYKGMLTDGSVFDQSTTTPAVFQLGGLITAWKNVIPKIKEGGRLVMYVPPALGYGNTDARDQNGNVVIPANSILIFEVDLLQVQ